MSHRTSSRKAPGLLLAATLASGCAGAPPHSRPAPDGPPREAFSPSLSFTMATFSAGEMDRVCGEAVGVALTAGYTTMTLVPTLKWNVDTHALEDPALAPGEITRCLDHAWSKGLNIAFLPHVDERSFEVWRAELDVRPDDRYYHQTFDEFLGWLGGKARDLSSGARHVDVLLAGEMETSVALHASDWARLARRLRGAFTGLGLHDGAVRLAYNPNWAPLDTIGRAPDCGGMRDFVTEVDFVSYSAYGDWSKTHLGERQIALRITEMQNSLSFRYGCDLHDPVAARPATFGEFATGLYLSESAHWADRDDPVDKTVYEQVFTRGSALSSHYLDRRLQLYRNLLAYHARPRLSLPALPLNVWSHGIFDPVGTSAAQSEPLIDPRIAKLMQDYSRTTHR